MQRISIALSALISREQYRLQAASKVTKAERKISYCGFRVIHIGVLYYTSTTVIWVSLKCIWIYTFVKCQLTRPPFPRVATASAPSVNTVCPLGTIAMAECWFPRARQLAGICGINRNRRRGCCPPRECDETKV